MTSQSGKAMSGCTCLRLRKASRRVSQIYDRVLEPLGLTVTQYSLLSYLRTLEGISIGVLADRLAMDPTTLTRNIRPLERQGYVVLAHDPNDRRSRCLQLTRSGRSIQDKAKPAWARAQRHIDKTLSDIEALDLNATLDRVVERLGQNGS